MALPASKSFYADFYLPLKISAVAEMEAEFYARAAAAEAARPAETSAATTLEACWRGYQWRVELKRLNAKALMLARCTRGFLHRQAARAARRQLNLARQRKAFAGCATVLQKRYRAFHSRRYTHDYYARKAYLAVLLHKGEAVRKALAEQMQAEAEQRRSQAEEQSRARVHHLASKLHHLRSTAICPSIYNSPYHVGFHATAHGIPVEEHLRTALRSSLKAEVLSRQKNRPPVQSLPPIHPLLPPGVSEVMLHEEERQQRWLSKASRMGTQDFNARVSARKLPHLPSVHNTEELAPCEQRQIKNFERPITKDKWVSTQPFVPQVPSNRILASTVKGEARLLGTRGGFGSRGGSLRNVAASLVPPERVAVE